MTYPAEAIEALYSVDEARELLDSNVTSSITLGEHAHASFEAPVTWPVADFAMFDDDESTGAGLTVGGHEYEFTKKALLDFTSKFHLSKKYVSLLPPSLLTPQMNYWVVENTSDIRLLVNGSTIIGVSKSPSAPLFSSEAVFDYAVGALHDATGVLPSEMYVDYKLTNSLDETAFRLIVPGLSTYQIAAQRDGETKADLWNYGVSVRHSQSALFPTSVEGYLFAWWCTNGQIATHASSGKFDRRSHEADLSVLGEWLTEKVEDISVDMPLQFADLAKMPGISLKGEMSEAADSVFKRYRVPTEAREAVLSNLVESDDWSAYGLMNAVTQAANPSDTDEKLRNLLFRAGGDMAAAFSNRCDTCHRLD